MESMKEIKNIAQFAKAHGLTRQGLEKRIANGWKFGVLNGEKVMYNPNNVTKVVEL